RDSVAAFEPARHRQVAKARGLDVSAGQHREHARRHLGLRRVDRANARMGVGRAQHVAERHAGEHHVGHIAPAAFDQPWVLEPGNRLTYGEFTHRNPRISTSRHGPSTTPSRWPLLLKCPADSRALMKTFGLTSTWKGLQSGATQQYATTMRL